MINLGDKYAAPELRDYATFRFCDCTSLKGLFHLLPDIYDSAAGKPLILRRFIYQVIADYASEGLEDDDKRTLLDMMGISSTLREDTCEGWLSGMVTRKGF